MTAVSGLPRPIRADSERRPEALRTRLAFFAADLRQELVATAEDIRRYQARGQVVLVGESRARLQRLEGLLRAVEDVRQWGL